MQIPLLILRCGRGDFIVELLEFLGLLAVPSALVQLCVVFAAIEFTLALLPVVLLSEVHNAYGVHLLLAEQAEEASAVLLLELVAFPWLDAAKL